MKDIEMWHGDCLHLLGNIQDSSVQLVVADLPYGILSHRNWDKQIDLAEFWRQVTRILLPRGVIACFANMRFALSLIASNSKKFRYDIVWHKHVSSSFLMANKRPLNRHEHVLIFANPSHQYNPQMRPHEERLKTWTPRNNAIYTSRWHVTHVRRPAKPFGPMHPTSVYKTNESRKKNIHCTQKPLSLLSWLVASYSSSGELVVDPCAGSMGTAIAAQTLGRRVVCIEKDAEYFSRGVKRVKQDIAKTRGVAK